jgi:beta-phosphoglucomutase-like phosphatase (HAD superfamily)
MEGRTYWYHAKLKESRWTKPETVQQLKQTKMDENGDDSDEDAPPDPIKEFLELLHEQNIPLTMKWD